jgi:hypothetical protein
VLRHREHLPKALAQAKEATEVAHGDDLLGQLRDLQKLTMGLLAKAVRAEDLRTAATFISQARQNLELLAKLLGELDERPQVNVLLAPEWLTVRATVLTALAPYPEARVAVAQQLATLESSNGHR